VANALVDRDADGEGHTLFNGLAVLALAAENQRRLGIDGVVAGAANVDNLGANDAL